MVLGGVALLAVLALVQNQDRGESPSAFSTYDFGRNGYAALFDMLHRENVVAGQFERPIGLLDRTVRTLVVSASAPSEESAGLSRGDADALHAWVQAGGILVILGRPAIGDAKLKVPSTRAMRRTVRSARVAKSLAAARARRVAGAFDEAFATLTKRRISAQLVAAGKNVAIRYSFGRGTIVAITDPSVFSNSNLARADNARYAYALLASGPVAFDERVHGYARDRSFWAALPPPVRIAVALTIAIVALALLGANWRFAPPLLPDARDERDSSAYIESMARLLQRGRAAPRAIRDCAEPVARALRARAGARPQASLEALRELDALGRLERPSDFELVRAGRLSAQLRKDLE
jgi:hypothetical protein